MTTSKFTTEQINAKLEVKSLSGLKFACAGRVVCIFSKRAFGLYVDGMGWLAFNSNVPYSPRKNALEEIQRSGLLNYNDVRWVNPMAK